MNPEQPNMHLPVVGAHRRATLDFLKWYQGPDRFYHNLTHIHECLDHMRNVATLLTNPQAVWTAIWFHDCVYSTLPGAKNEELSAAEARRWIQDEDVRRIVTNLILVTKHSDMYPPMTSDECFMCDIDLTSLGDTPEKFLVNGQNIRLEYSRYNDSEYNTGRLVVLSYFLKRAHENKLYYTAYFRDRYLEQATANLQFEVTRLQSLCINTGE